MYSSIQMENIEQRKLGKLITTRKKSKKENFQ